MSGSELHPATLMEEIADAQPEAPALSCGEVTRVWAELDDRAARLAASLAGGGVSRFAGVGLMLRNGSEYLEIHHGIHKARAVPVNVNYRYREDELAYLLEDCDCEALFFDASFAPTVARLGKRLERLRLRVCVDDGEGEGGEQAKRFDSYEEILAAHPPAPRQARDAGDPYLFYTGGTTGMPKGMAMKVGDRVSGEAAKMAANTLGLPGSIRSYGAATAAELRRRGEAPVSLPAAPLMHSTAINAAAMPSLLFGGCVLTRRGGSFVPAQVLETAAAGDATNMAIGGDSMAKPLQLELETAAAAGRPYRLPKLSRIVSAGMAWSQEAKRGIMRLLPEVELMDLYGSTEGLAGSRCVRPGDQLSDVPTFEPVPGIRLLDEDDAEVPPGTAGRVAFPVPAGEHYHGDEAKTSSAFRDLDGTRFAVPGDYAVIDPDGSLRPIGRGAKVVNSGGEKIFTEEVEGVIREFEQVVDCLAFGLPDERWGERLVALVAAVPGAELGAGQIRDGVRASLADFKVPKDVVFVPSIPRHANSKADFRQARLLATSAGPRDATGV